MCLWITKNKKEENYGCNFTHLPAGTGDIATDMENQVKANIMRIQVLEDLNERLRRSITKVLSAGLGTSASSNSVPKVIPLCWKICFS